MAFMTLIDFLHSSCQAEFTLCTGDAVIKPSEWTDLFAFWEKRCAAVISMQSITIPKPTRTVSPEEKSQARLGSCDVNGAADRGLLCTKAELSASSCLSTTVDATNTLGAFPCLCNAGLLQLMDECDASGNFVKCGGSTSAGEVPWPTRLRSTCRSYGLNPVGSRHNYATDRVADHVTRSGRSSNLYWTVGSAPTYSHAKRHLRSLGPDECRNEWDDPKSGGLAICLAARGWAVSSVSHLSSFSLVGIVRNEGSGNGHNHVFVIIATDVQCKPLACHHSQL